MSHPGRPRRPADARPGRARPDDPGRRPMAARELALRALYRIEVEAAYASLALAGEFRRTPADRRERALATELTYGVSRRRNTLDHLVGRCSRRPVDGLTPWIRNVLRLGAYQIFYMDKIPPSAAVDEAVTLARRYGHAGTAALVNAVLRCLVPSRGQVEDSLPKPEADPVAYLSIAESHPEWLVRRWLARYGFADARGLMQYDNASPPVVVRANRLKVAPEALAARLAEEGVTAAPGRYLPEALRLEGPSAVEGLPSFRAGLFQVQDESSMLAAWVVDPQPGELVIDAAAAPGGKTTHLAERMGGRGRVIANDVHAGRLALVEENCRRLGIANVEPVAGDGRDLPARWEGQADRVLLDAPCSGLGVLNRRPDARWRKTEEQVAALPALQGELLAAAARCVRPGGVLVYSTCTTEPEENGGVCDRFLAAHPGFAPESLAPYLPAPLAAEPGVEGGRLQLLPFRHGVDGFFIARFRRLEDGCCINAVRAG